MVEFITCITLYLLLVLNVCFHVIQSEMYSGDFVLLVDPD